MNKLFLSFLLIFVLQSMFATEALFQDFDKIPAYLLMPRNAEIKADGHGGLLVNGKIRYLIGTELGLQQFAADFAPSVGYPECYKWLYEGVMNYQTAQRLGFDTIAVFTPDRWIKKLYRNFKVTGSNNPQNTKMAGEILSNRLPILVDYTCFPWRHGKILSLKKLNKLLPEEALNRFNSKSGNHWVPYNIFHPSAQKIYCTYWGDGVKLVQKYRSNVFAYELFNEPSYNDSGRYNRMLFKKYLQEKYHNIAAMNQVWNSSYKSFQEAADFSTRSKSAALFVDWGKFLEQGFTRLFVMGRNSIRALDSNARCTMQMLGYNNYRALPSTNINIYEISKYMDVISTSTCGGLYLKSATGKAPKKTLDAPSNLSSISEGILERHFYRSIADGKIIVNPEAYPGATRELMCSRIWVDMLRGSSATYLFMWHKRAWAWMNNEAKGMQAAEKFPFMLANPYAVSTKTLSGISQAKKEIYRYGDFLLPQKHRPKAEIAVLISFPTERYSAAVGDTVKNEILNYAAALEFSHYPIDVILEEQLPDRLQRYRVVIAVGISNTQKRTPGLLLDFVKQGGTLIAARRIMSQNEYGNKISNPLFNGLQIEINQKLKNSFLKLDIEMPELLKGKIVMQKDISVIADKKWQVIGKDSSGSPQVLRRKAGAGNIYFIAPRMQDYAIAGTLGALLHQEAVNPLVKIRRIPQGDMAMNIESHCANKDGIKMIFLFNLDPYPKLSEFFCPDKECVAVDLFEMKQLPQKFEWTRFLIGKHSRKLIAVGKPEKLQRLFGDFSKLSAQKLSRRFEKLEQLRRTERARAVATQHHFDVDESKIVTLNLRSYCNSGFIDKKSGDGKGEWTDQGQGNSLDGVPWGLQKFRGIPCELIRFDSNDNRTCIILDSKSCRRKLPASVKGIMVNDKVKALYFFHTSAFSRTTSKVLTYRIHYSDGKILDVPVRSNHEIGDWWISPLSRMKKNAVWKNQQNRGFYIYEWKNPEPNREITSIDLISAQNKTIPIVIAISYERLDKSKEIFSAKNFKIKAFGNCQADVEGGLLKIVINSRTKVWAGIRIIPIMPGGLDFLQDDAVLKFKINGGLDTFGKRQGGQILQCRINRRVKLKRLDNDSDSFEKRTVKISSLLKIDGKTGKKAIVIQFRGTGRDSGVELRNLRIEQSSKTSDGS